jgi:hypothetical protein
MRGGGGNEKGARKVLRRLESWELEQIRPKVRAPVRVLRTDLFRFARTKKPRHLAGAFMFNYSDYHFHESAPLRVWVVRLMR